MADPLSQEGTRQTSNTKSEQTQGTVVSAGPYVGTIKQTIDNTYGGRLLVFIPELGGDPTNVSSWKTMRYASPFYGETNIQDGGDYSGSPHTYGMWFVPPDVGNQVLCILSQGKDWDGFWFACIPDVPSNHMVPGISAPVDGSSQSPVVDAYIDQTTASRLSNIHSLPKQVHTIQQQIWQTQGLLNDSDRGPGTSSSQRETPSSVFGISTPGRPIKSTDPDLYADPESNGSSTVSQILGVRGRQGGHTFVMDDGDAQGNNQMMRLRTATGHMIMMNDTKGFIYVINSKGTAWVEINATGDINVYAQSNLNIEAKGGMQLETQGALKIHGKTVDIVSDGAFNIQGTDINVLGSGNTKITGKTSLHLKAKNTYLTGDSCIQIKSDGHIDLKATCHTINTADATKATEAGPASSPSNMPTAEPWTGHKSPAAPTSQPGYGQQQGLPPSNGNNSSSAGPYGAANNFGSSTVQQNYGPMTNNVPPVVYNDNIITSAGQGSQDANTSPPPQQPGVSYLVSGAIAGAIAGIAFGTGARFDVTQLSPGNNSNINYTTGELQNNPGNLPYNTSDTYAIGFAHNLAVYSQPEQGIAALATLFQNFNTSTSVMCIDLITKYLNAQTNQDPNVINMTRFMKTNLGINSTDYVALTDPTTLLGWVSSVIRYVQGGLIYTYDQMVSGCALSLGMSNTMFLNALQPINQPWQNNGATNQYSGFVNPATTSSITNNGSSPLQQIATRVISGVLGNAIGQALRGGSSNQQSSSAGPSQTINAATNGATETDNSGYRDMKATTSQTYGGYSGIPSTTVVNSNGSSNPTQTYYDPTTGRVINGGTPATNTNAANTPPGESYYDPRTGQVITTTASPSGDGSVTQTAQPAGDSQSALYQQSLPDTSFTPINNYSFASGYNTTAQANYNTSTTGFATLQTPSNPITYNSQTLNATEGNNTNINGPNTVNEVSNYSFASGYNTTAQTYNNTNTTGFATLQTPLSDTTANRDYTPNPDTSNVPLPPVRPTDAVPLPPVRPPDAAQTPSDSVVNTNQANNETINAAQGNNPAITGSPPSTGTGGQTGAQTAPGGSADTGGAGKSC